MYKKIYLFIVILFICSTVFAMDYISSPLVSGEYYDIAVKNNIAYAANIWGLLIFDVTDKENPQLVNSIPTRKSTHTYIHNNLLFLGGQIYDISDQVNPVFLSEIPFYYTDFKIVDSYLFAIGYDSDSNIFKLGIIRIDDISNPQEIVQIDSVVSYDIKDNYLYTTKYDLYEQGFTIKTFNISNIENPLLVNELSVSQSPNYGQFPYIFINDIILYCAGSQHLYTISIENPEEPEIIDELECNLADESNKIIRYDNYLFLRYGHIVDISTPYLPQIVGFFPVDWPPSNMIMGIYINENYIYVTNWEYGFYIMDLSNPIEPEQTSWYVNWNFYFGIYKSGNCAYVASMNGLIILDVSDPENGIEIGNCYTGWSNDVLVEDNYAYMASDGGFIILDVSDPENLYVIDDYSFSCDNLIKENNLVYTLNDVSAVIKIFDVNNPHNIQFLGSCDLMFNALDLCFKDNYLYVAGGYAETAPAGYDPGGLKIVDVTDPYNPQWINSINPDSTKFFRAIEIKDNYIFMGSNEPGIYVFDVSNPLSPFVYSYIEVDQEAGICDMEIQGYYLYTTSLRGKYIFDISEINSIELVDFYPGGESNNCWSISVDGNYIYEASTYSVNIYFSSITGFEEFEQNLLYKKIILNQNFPNPFNPDKIGTAIRYGIPRNLWKIPISLNIYNIRGQLVKTLINNQTQKGGYYEMIWDGKDNFNHVVASGVYLYQLTAGNRKSSIKKMLSVK